MSSFKNYDPEDLDEISQLAKAFRDKFSNRQIVVAGATGFVGSWLVSSFEHMRQNYNFNVDVLAISRSSGFHTNLAFPNTKYISLDISDDIALDMPAPDCVFNAATPSTPAHGGEDSRQVLQAAIRGTDNLIKVCTRSPGSTFINLSSGIVTKREGEISTNLANLKDAYLEGKRKSEELVTDATHQGIISGKNLRLYSFAGPGISLEYHFAVGNFMNDALRGRPISILGNPETRRSYLYPTDLIVNILSAATSPSTETMELGSTIDLSMKELAQQINSLTGNVGINQSSDYRGSDMYFPTIQNLDINQRVSLDSSLTRWMNWIRNS